MGQEKLLLITCLVATLPAAAGSPTPSSSTYRAAVVQCTGRGNHSDPPLRNLQLVETLILQFVQTAGMQPTFTAAHPHCAHSTAHTIVRTHTILHTAARHAHTALHSRCTPLHPLTVHPIPPLTAHPTASTHGGRLQLIEELRSLCCPKRSDGATGWIGPTTRSAERRSNNNTEPNSGPPSLAASPPDSNPSTQELFGFCCFSH